MHELGLTCRWPTLIQVTRVNSRSGFAIDDSIITIVLV